MDCSQHGRGDVVTCPWSSLSLDAGQRVDASMPGALRVRNTTATCTSNMNNDRIDTAISTCPFLRYVSHQRGVNYTRKLITTPVVSMVVDGSHDHDVHNDTKKSKKVVPLFPEDEGRAFDTVLQLFHPGAGQTRTRGQMGSVDGCLGMEEGSRESVQCNVGEERIIGGWIGECQRNNAVEAEEEGGTRERVGGGRRAGHVGSLPSGMASISLAGFQFMPDPHDLMMKFQARQKRRQEQQKRRPKPKRSGKGGGNAGRGTSIATTNQHSVVGNVPPSRRQSSNANLGGKGSPLGGLIPLAVGAELRCPKAVVAMRAAVARMKVVQQLRPQTLPIRSFALASVAVLFNFPCGAVREHTKKFSPEWFVAVHATIPFIAMLRKAVMMPVWGLGLTVAGSLIGQHIGSTLERKRMEGMLPNLGAMKLDSLPQQAVKMLLPDGHIVGAKA